MGPFHLTGKTALVTGAANGIGAACAEALAMAGAQVMVTDVAATGEYTAASLREKGASAEFCRLDVTDEDDWRKAVATSIDTLGGLDILVNNAGIEIARSLTEMTLEEWRLIFRVNVEGVFLGTKHAVTAMRPGGKAGRGGSIVNLSSVAGIKGYPGFSGYGASKGAVRHFSKAAAKECGPMNVRINSVHPGVIRTEMGERAIRALSDIAFGGEESSCMDFLMGQTPLGRLGVTADIASVVLFLASDASCFVTGTELVVDGGLIS